MSKEPLVTIITVNYKGKKYLKRCFNSLYNLSYPKDKIEIIMVDNGSNDGSIDFVKERFPEVKIIKNDVNNYCKANNLGIREAKGEYIGLINNDMKADRNWLGALVKVILQDKTIGVVGSKILSNDRKIQNAGHYELPNFYWGERGAGSDRRKYSEVEEVPSLCGASVLYRRSCLEEVELFDEDFIMYSEDVDMSVRLRQKGWKIVFVPGSIVYHTFHGTGNEELSRFYIERNRLLFLAKHYPYKLSTSLFGSGYFTTGKDASSTGRLYSLLPDVILKLIKHHKIEFIKDVSNELFEELKKVTNYENDLLLQKVITLEQKVMSEDEKVKNFISQLRERDEELANLSNQLRQRMDEVLIKDGQLLENDGEISAIKSELANLSKQLRQRMDEALIKDGQLVKNDGEISAIKSELANLSKQLRQRMDEVLIKDGQLLEKNGEISALKSELNSIYNSEGFRFVLHPLWTAIWNARQLLRIIKRKMRRIVLLTFIIALAPVFMALVASFLLEGFSWAILCPMLALRKRATKKRQIVPFEDLKVTLVIPNWNGADYLRECLPSVFAAKGFREGENEVLVVDDGSVDDSVSYIKSNFPQVRLIQNRRNKGFSWTCNRGVTEAKNELIVLINNDIILTEDFLKPLVQHFKDENVFVVTPKLYAWDKKTFVWGMHMGQFKNGYICLWNEAETKNGDRIQQTAPSIFAIGGAMVFRKRDFLWLGGFDEIYRPNCWEDIDISYRAWKRGLKVLYEPHSLMYHKGKATLSYERHKEIKNELLFTWKNITDVDILRGHLKLLPYHLYTGGITFLKGLIWALRYLPQALYHRFKDRRNICSTDKDIFNRCMLYYRNFERAGFKHAKDKRTILLITSFMPYPLKNGGKIRIYTLAKLLKDRFNILLLTLIDREDEVNYIPELKKVFKDVYTVLPKSPLSRVLYPQRYKYAYSQHLIEKLKEIQRVYPLDLIQIESNELLYLTKFVKYIPVVYTEHDASILSFRRSYYQRKESFISNLLDYLKRVYFHNAVYKRLAKIITLSKEDEKTLRTFFPYAQFSFVPTGVDLEHFSFNFIPSQSKFLIFVGHYPHYPNEDTVVYFCKNIFPLIKKEVPEVKFLIVGSSPTERIRQLSQQEGVELIGEVFGVRTYLDKAAVFVNAVRVSAGIKGKVFEAMATGVPVVSTGLGSWGIDAEAEKEILIANNPVEFARKTIRLLQDEKLRQKIAQNARHLVEEKYDWQKIKDVLDITYRETMYDASEQSQDTTPPRKLPDEHEIVAVKQTKISQETKPQPGLEQILDKTKTIVEGLIEDTDCLITPEQGPQELHMELTYRCNSKCIMCDLWDYQKRTSKTVEDELSLDEIKRFVETSKYLRRAKTVVLSGGEPFLREDIAEICGFFIRHLPDASIGILTNGVDTNRLINKTKEIQDRFQPKSLWLGSSLDGLGEAHDEIRGAKGAFSALGKTIEGCRRQLSNVNFSVTFTLTPYNINQLIPAKEFADKEGLDFFVQFVVPKQARENFSWTQTQLAEVENKVHKIMENLIGDVDTQTFHDSLEGRRNGPLLPQLYYWSHLVKYQKAPERFFKKCIAGAQFAMFDPYGDLFFCPILKDKVIGNIREKGFDQLWMSDKARQLRNFIKNKCCHCWLVCVVLPIVGTALAKNRSRPFLKSQFRPAKREDVKDSEQTKEIVQQKNISLNDVECSSAKIILDSTPQGIGIGAHYQCNAKCVFCLGGAHQNFSLDIYQKFFELKLKSALPKAKYVNFCGFGELLMMPGIEKFLNYINEKLPYTNKVLTTNGIPLTPKVINKITQSKYAVQISLHSSHSQLHRLLTKTVFFDQIVNQIRYLVSLRRREDQPHINLIFLINTLNIEDLPDFIELAAQLGVDKVTCNYMTIYTAAHLKLSCFFKQDMTNLMLQRAEEVAEKLRISVDLPPRFAEKSYFKNGICSEPWKYFYVETEGSILPCCYAGNHIGYLNQQEFETIWNGDFYRTLRKSLVENDLNGWCKYCYKSNPANVNDLRSHTSFRPDLQEKILQGYK